MTEWKNFLKIFLDFVVRSNQSVYLKLGDDSTLDIFACQRFGTSKPARRPVHEPKISGDRSNGGSRFPASALMLAALIEDPNKTTTLSEVVFNNRDAINKVLGALWRNLTIDTQLLQLSQRYKDDRWVIDEDNDNDGITTRPYRMNVIDISFKAVERAWLCDARLRLNDSPVMRPIDTLFMGMSPMALGNKIFQPQSQCEKWDPFPFKEGKNNGVKVQSAEITLWAQKNDIYCGTVIFGARRERLPIG